MKIKITKLISLLFLLLCNLIHVDAQIKVRNDGSFGVPNNLIRDILAGNGVIINNVKSYGSPIQFGYFSNGEKTIGLDKGIIMSTGNVLDAQPRDGKEADTQIGDKTPGQGAGDADLLKLSKKAPPVNGNPTLPSLTEDAAIIEFDFIPSSDSLVFRFVFASEEYPKYQNTKYNDIFGFFISGPGISGDYSSPSGFPNGSANIAFVPNTDFPITVRTINNVANSQYYIDNFDPSSKESLIEYNGYTVVFTAKAKVKPCETYHIKLAIADAEADNIDSGVFIEAKSFASTNFSINTKLGITKNDSISLEGCSTAEVILKKNSSLTTNDTVFININPSSTASLDDLVNLPEYVIFPPNKTEINFTFSFKNENIKEGLETLILDFLISANCESNSIKTVFYIDDAASLSFNENIEELKPKCLDSLAVCKAIVNGGFGFYKYLWQDKAGNSLATKSDQHLFTVKNDTEFKVTVTDTCGYGPITKLFKVIAPNYAPIKIDLPDTIAIQCKGKAFTLNPLNISGGSSIYTYAWTKNDSLVGTLRAQNTSTTIDSYYVLKATDECGTFEKDSLFLNITDYNSLVIVGAPDTAICLNSTINLSVKVTGGAGSLSYLWTPGNFTTNTITVSPKQNTTFTFTVTDECSVRKTTDVFIDVTAIKADFEFYYDDNDKIIINNFSSGKITRYDWLLDKAIFSRETTPALNLQEDYLDHELSLIVADATGCLDTNTQLLQPPLELYIPTAFTPDGDGRNDVFSIAVGKLIEFELFIYDRWGGLVFKTNNPNFTWDGRNAQSGQINEGRYHIYVKAVRDAFTRTEKRGSVMLLK